ncbi:MAG: glycosyl transferase family protein [Erythrobacter sp.]|nr:glycosyl transferase family protein [Erythrobacter sp.]NCQ63643.1 glycosyl transferase family protein [Alphaproteobacteria bacterium]
MEVAALSPGDWLGLFHHELLLFASLFFLLGTLDEILIDLVYLVGRVRGRLSTVAIDRRGLEGRALSGPVAVIVPAWCEEQVIGATMRHLLSAWPQSALRLYVGCYANDPATIAAAARAARGHDRARIVVSAAHGPTTKADCMNRLYRAIEEDEAREGIAFRMVVIHDAEDMVDPAALPLFDANLARADLLQLPVSPAPQAGSRWVAGHYMDEFAEAHAKAMVVRDWLGAGIPSAGVGCAVARGRLALLDAAAKGRGPFDADSLTEDYELGLRIAEGGGRTAFLRARGEDGRLVATRAYFPRHLTTAVRQKTRWICGISLQGWDRMGWGGNLLDGWMRLRDRRGPMAALVLFAAYMLVIVTGALVLLGHFGLARPVELSPLVEVLLYANGAGLVWRAVNRAAFTAREYGWREGLRAVLRIPLSNIIAIMAGRRAVAQYVATLRGGMLQWDKTEHRGHPSLARQATA